MAAVADSVDLVDSVVAEVAVKDSVVAEVAVEELVSSATRLVVRLMSMTPKDTFCRYTLNAVDTFHSFQSVLETPSQN